MDESISDSQGVLAVRMHRDRSIWYTYGTYGQGLVRTFPSVMDDFGQLIEIDQELLR